MWQYMSPFSSEREVVSADTYPPVGRELGTYPYSDSLESADGSIMLVVAFSTHPSVRKPRTSDRAVSQDVLVNASMSPLFAATAEATEEAIYNAIFKATTVTSSRGTLEAIPIGDLERILKKHGVLDWDQSLPPQ